MNMRQVFHFFKPIPGYQTAHALPHNDILFSAAAGSLLLIDQFNCALEKSGIGLDEHTCQHHSDDVRDTEFTHDDRGKEDDEEHYEEYQRRVCDREVLSDIDRKSVV